MKLYTIFDIELKEAGPLFEAKNDNIAMRQYRLLLKEVNYKADFELYEIGEYDHETMELIPFVGQNKIEVLDVK